MARASRHLAKALIGRIDGIGARQHRSKTRTSERAQLRWRAYVAKLDPARHVLRMRAVRVDDELQGAGFALPGFVLGVVLIVISCGGTFLDWFPLRGLTSDNWSELSLFERPRTEYTRVLMRSAAFADDRLAN